jgi:ribosomal protein L11 methyltransferase
VAAELIEVQLVAQVDSGELIGMMDRWEPLGAWENNGVLHLYWEENKWMPEVLQALREALNRMGFAIDERDFKVSSVPDRDWDRVWRESLHPICIGRRIRIRQSWNRPDAEFEGIELVVDPKRAFGSGYHATTQMILEWLEDSIVGGESVLDIGTGSGILAMIALRLGAGSALGIDHDPVAIECARENAQKNGFGPELALRAVPLEDLASQRFDLIVANLDRETLLRCCRNVLAHLADHGRACFSGFQTDDWADISGALGEAGARILGRKETAEWMALEVQVLRN